MNTEEFYKFISASLGVDHSHCSQCKVNKTLYMCGGCFAASFCGKECQEAAWVQSHHKECMYIQGKRGIEDGEGEEYEDALSDRDKKRGRVGEYEKEEEEEERLIDLADPKLQDVLYLLIEFLSKRDIRSIAFTKSPFFDAFRDILFKTQTYKIETNILDDEIFKAIAPYIRNVFIGQSMDVADVYRLSQMAPSIKQLTFDDVFDQNVRGALPTNLTHLTFGWNFDQNVRGALPTSLTHLTFGWNFNQDVRDALPKSLTHLTFGYDFNQDVCGALPPNLTHLTFNGRFDQDVRGALPTSLTHLTFGRNFNRDLRDALPESLTHLDFGDYFNQDVRGALPPKLTHLTFGRNFNRDLRDALPESLTHLDFGDYFNQDVRGALPPNLTHLTFGLHFNQDLRDVLPIGLMSLMLFQRHYIWPTKYVLPTGLKTLTVLYSESSKWIDEANRVGATLRLLEL